MATEEIKLLVHETAFTNSHDFEQGALKMMGVKLEKNAPFVGKTVMDSASVYPGVHFMPIALKKENTDITIIPRGDTVFSNGDQLYFITDEKGLKELYNLLGTVKQNIQNVMILGAGRIGYKLAKDLSSEGLNIKIIEIFNGWNELRSIMSAYVGIVRSTSRLRKALKRIHLLQEEVTELSENYYPSKDLIEVRNLVICAELITKSALNRKESRGLHFMKDQQRKSTRAMPTILRSNSII